MRKIPLDKMPREIEKKRCQINKKEISENISNGSQCDGKSFVESGKILGDKRRGGGGGFVFGPGVLRARELQRGRSPL